MIILTFNNLKNLNVSLQVGDAVYARNTVTQAMANDPQAGFTSTGATHHIGTLVRIDRIGPQNYDLYINDDLIALPYNFVASDFIMFSKFSQGDSGVLGYYAEAKFVNDSIKKAELFAVSSEIIINSN